MKKVLPKRFSEFVEVALRAGATAARIIPSRQVVIDERVRFKCEVPKCAGYGQYLTCPPYVMSVEVFSKILSCYKWGLLIQVEAKNIDSSDKGKGRINRIILKEYKELCMKHGYDFLQQQPVIVKVSFVKPPEPK